MELRAGRSPSTRSRGAEPRARRPPRDPRRPGPRVRPDVDSAAALAAAATSRRLRRHRATGPSISADDPLLGALGHIEHTHGLPVAEDRRPVAQRRDLEHPVGDEDDRPARFADLAHDVQHPFGEVGWEGRGHLVEQQQVGLRGEGARKVDDPQRRQRQLAHVRPQVELADAQVAQQAPERRDGGLGEAQVLRDLQVGDQRRLLVDGDDARATRLGGRADEAIRCRAPGWCRHRGGSAPVRILTKVLLPAPLAPSRAWTSPGRDAQRGVAQRGDRAVSLGDAGGLEQQVGHGPVMDWDRGAGDGRRPLITSSGYSPGPLQATSWPCRTWSSPGSCS